MYRNIYIDKTDNYSWFYYVWEMFNTRRDAENYAKQLIDFRTTYRKTVKIPENIHLITITSRTYVDKSVFQ